MRTRATITSGGRVTIPVKIRRRLGLEEGDAIDFVLEGDVIHLRPAKRSGDSFESGMGAHDSPSSDDEEDALLRRLLDEE